MKRNLSLLNTGARLALGLALLALAGGCMVGFMATFEPMAAVRAWLWRVAYGGVGLGCVAGALKLALPGRAAISKAED
jgi:hypothetical protein